MGLHVTLLVWRWGRGGWWWGGRLWKDPVGRCDARAAEARGARAAGALRPLALSNHRRRPDRSHRRGPERRIRSACRQGGFKSGHGLGGGAAAGTPLGRIWIPDHHGVERASSGVLGSAGVLVGLQCVQNNIRGMFGYILSLQFTQLMESCVHGFFYVLINTEDEELMITQPWREPFRIQDKTNINILHSAI